TGSGVQHTGHAVDLRGLKRLFEGERRQDGGHTFGEHCLARTRRADHEDVMSPGTGDFQGPLSCLLAAYVFEVDGVMLCLAEKRAAVDLHRLNSIAGI